MKEKLEEAQKKIESVIRGLIEEGLAVDYVYVNWGYADAEKYPGMLISVKGSF